MSPDMQQFESNFKPSDPSRPPPFDQARYQEELQDFTNFFERLTSLDSRDWFASEDSPRPAPARAAPAAQATQAVSRPAAALPEPVSTALSAADAAGEAIAAEGIDAEPADQSDMESAASAPDTTAPAAVQAPASTAAARPMRMPVFHSDLASRQPGAIPALPEAFPPVRGGLHQRSGFRTFLNRLQWGLMILFGGTLLFAMGLGMGALVLSIPQRHNPFDAAASPQAGAPAAADSVAQAATGQVPATVAGPATPAPANAPAAKSASRKTKHATASATTSGPPAPAMTAPLTPAGLSKPEAAKTETMMAAAPATPAGALANTAAPVASAPVVSAPIVSAPIATAPASFALQVGACGSYACVEQFRNLLLAEVDSKMINVVTAGGGQSMQRIRVEPLSRDAANQLKDKLAAKDPRFGQAYLVTLR